MAKKLFRFIKENKQYVLAALALIMFFLIGRIFPANIITSKSCEGGKCKAVIKAPDLTNEKPRFYVNDIFNSREKEFYRIIFEAKSNRPTSLSIFAANPLDENKKMKEVELESVNNYQTKEIFLASDKIYTDLLFKKNNPQDGADVSIGHIYISRLNISSEEEIKNLSPTIIGGADAEILDQKQENNSASFDQLKEPGVFLGQTFEAEFNYITGVSLDIDIIKQSNMGDKKYSLELREVEDEDTVPNIKSDPLAIVKFSADGIEEFRQENGKFLFPIMAKLKKDKKYFIGINNDNVKTNEFNYLIPKGTKNGNAYAKGSAAVKYKKYSYLTTGDLYFKTFGFNLKEYEGYNILPGTIIEDRGKGQLFFSYSQRNNKYEFINSDSVSEDIYFDGENNYMAGTIREGRDSFIIYKVNTIHPFKNFSISASQGDLNLNKIRIYFSFDKKDWQEAPWETKNELQVWDYTSLQVPNNQKEIYVKIEPEKDKYPGQTKFGVKNFKFQAELIK
ncbi:MAG TPA: hypothetical protein PLK35_00100 [Candidatus Moranbacteria bacterium]|nr:hypothetical protein [Candidatus Moranbacteria bacterium]